MQPPDFTADASLYKSQKHYHTFIAGAGSSARAFPAQAELGPDEGGDEMGGDCLSACLQAGGSEEECAEECSGDQGAV